MRISEAIDEIVERTAFLACANDSAEPNAIRDTVLKSLLKPNYVGRDNGNLASISAYYRNLIVSCQRLYKVDSISLSEYLYFFLQNFLSRSLPRNLAYIKISKLSSIDLCAPCADISDHIVCYAQNYEIEPTELDTIKKTQSILSNSLPGNYLTLSPLSELAHHLKTEAKKVGGCSIVLNDIEASASLFEAIYTNAADFSEFLIAGNREELDGFKHQVKSRGVQLQNFREIFLGDRSKPSAPKKNSIAYFQVVKPT